MSKILITGATGQLGKLVVKQLLAKTSAENVAVFVRDANKAEELKSLGVEVRVGNYDEYSTIVKGFEGIDKLYFISASEFASRTTQQENIVKAAKEAGIKHIVYTSFERENETESSPIAFVADAHIKTEAWIKASGITYTIMKHNLYMDMIPMFIGDKVLETGVVYLPAGEGRGSFLTREDMAEMGVHVLTTAGHENKEYSVSSEFTYSYADVASTISEITGKVVKFVSPSVEEYTQTLTGAGVPAEYIGLFIAFALAIQQGEFAMTSSACTELLGKKPTTLKEYLTTIYKA